MLYYYLCSSYLITYLKKGRRALINARKMKITFYENKGTSAKLSDAQKQAIVVADLLLVPEFDSGKEVTFTNLSGRSTKVKKGMNQTLPIGEGFEGAKLAGISFAATIDKLIKKFKDGDGDEHPILNFTGWWIPIAPNTKFTDGKIDRQYSIFTGK